MTDLDHTLIVGAGSGLSASLARSARELSPKGIHVRHVVIDGGIGPSDPESPDLLHPDDIAKTCFQLYRQPRSTWALEVEIRPWLENF